MTIPQSASALQERIGQRYSSLLGVEQRSTAISRRRLRANGTRTNSTSSSAVAKRPRDASYLSVKR